MPDWRWVDRAVAFATHGDQLTIHGGIQGIRDENLLDSALARPRNLAAYGEPDAADLAASYAFGIARNHPFVDGNRRTALVMCEIFLADNGYALNASDAELVALLEGLAAGIIAEEELAAWFRERIGPA